MFPEREIRDILEYVWNNPYSDFYARRFRECGMRSPEDIKTLEDFQALPFISRDYLASDPWSLLHENIKKIYQIRATTGTTGKGYAFIFYKELLRKIPILSEEAGVSMLLLLCVVENIPFYHNQLREARKPFVLGDIYNLPKTALKAAFARIDGIETSPTIALNFAEHLKKHYDLGRIKAVGITGEILSQNLKARLQEEYPNATLFNSYGLIETSFLGWQCKRLSMNHTNIFHIHPDIIFYEVIDPQTRKPVKFGEAGELVVTNLKRMATPLIRYRTGDLARFLKNECPCGAEGDLIEVMGRSEYDFIRLGQGIDIDWTRVDNALFVLKDVIKDVQIRVRDKIRDSRLVPIISVYIVPADGTSNSEKEIGDLFMNTMMCTTTYSMKKISPEISLKKAAEMGLVELEVRFVGSIEKIGHKSRLLLDERSKHSP